MARAPHKSRMFALGGDAFPHDTHSLRGSLTRGAKPFGARDDAVATEGEFPSLAALRMNLTSARLDGRARIAAASEKTDGGFFSRVLEIVAEPALVGPIPVQLRVRAEDCVFVFGTTADGSRTVALQSCMNGTFDAAAATTDLESALFVLARDAAAGHGAEVESVRLTLESENPRRISVTAVAVAKAMFFKATLTIRGAIAVDEEFNLRLCDATCTGDGMIANLAAAQLRPRLAGLAARTFALHTFLPAGMQPAGITLAGGDTLRIAATFGAT